MLTKNHLVKRYAHNPILTAEDVPYPCDEISNVAAVKYKEEYFLLAGLYPSGPSTYSWALAKSKDGYKFKVEKGPVLTPPEGKRFYDPRMTKIGNIYYVVFGVDYPTGEVTTGLAKTEDFKEFQYLGEISEPDIRNTVLFPEKIGNYYVRLNRPFPLYYHWGWPAGKHPAVKEGRKWPSNFNIWISYSSDLIFWGKAKVILEVKDVPWASHKLGPGAPPIKTDKGWLEIFHGAELTKSGKKIYRLGCMLLDLNDPSKIIGLAKEPILEPEEPFEKKGRVPDVVFTCGAIPENDGTLKIYYGGADTCVCLAVTKTVDLVNLCLEDGI